MLLLLLEQLILLNITAYSSVGRASDCSCYNIRMVASSNLAGRIYIYEIIVGSSPTRSNQIWFCGAIG